METIWRTVHNFIIMDSDIAELQMKIAATQAALLTHEVTKNPDKYAVAREALCNTDKYNFAAVAQDIISNLSSSSKEVLLPYTSEGHEHSVGLDSDCESEEKQHQPPSLKEYFGGPNPIARARERNLVPSEVVNMPDDETDSVISEREQKEQDKLFERIVVPSVAGADEKAVQKAVADMTRLPGSIRWYKFTAVVAFRDEDWHSDIGDHLEENVQDYFDQYMENGGVVTKASFLETGEFGSTP